jgi:MFS family permease
MEMTNSQEENVIFARVSQSKEVVGKSLTNGRKRRQPRASTLADQEPLICWNQLYNEPLVACKGSDEEIKHPSNLLDTITSRRRKPFKRRFVLFRKIISPTVSLPLLVFIDMFAVSLVVPLLFQYYKAAGIQRADQREWLGSLFTTSQIAGGLTMGFLSDAKILTRRTILFLSFGGSALSYALIVYGGLTALIFSRMIVGLVKQTMTVARTILTKSTSSYNRSVHIGRLTAASTIAWIAGPSVGALLYKYVDTRAPALVACALFCCNLLLAALILKPDEDNDDDSFNDDHGNNNQDSSHNGETQQGALKIFSNLKQCFTSKQLGSAVLATLLMTWVTKATNYSQLGSFYEEMYGLEPHHRGYISSYQQALQFVVNVWLVTPVMQFTGGERRAICICTAVLTVAVFLESRQSLPLFIFAICPILSLCFAISDLSLQALVTHVAPTHSIFSVLAALDVLQNAVSVGVPFYRTLLFRWLPSEHALMQGDPDPVSWIYASTLHWFAAAMIMIPLLLPSQNGHSVINHDANKTKGR